MMTTDLGACEWFVWDLRRSNLINRGQLDQIIGEFLGKNPGAEPPGLAEYLVAQGFLTEFQAERLLQGKTQGFVLGPFTLMDALGTGSMGTVYKAQSKNDGNWYAVKVLPRRSMWNVRIARRKVRSFEQCQHPSVVPFVDVGTSGGMHYLAWPMVEGLTLDKIVEKDGKLPADQAAQYILQTAEGLELCHQQGLFHGLLKPSNLMLGPDGQIKILDFGIGCLLAETEGESLVDTMSTANSVNSGLDCSSPESIMDPTNLNAIGDQYSIGCVLYYFLTGRYPFPEGTAVEKMMCHQHKQPTLIKDLTPDAPDELVAIVERLMQKNPAARYASCAELLTALRPFVAPQATRRATQTMRSLPKLDAARLAAAQSQKQAAAQHSEPEHAPPTSPSVSSGSHPGRLNGQRPAQPLPPRSPSTAAAKSQPPRSPSGSAPGTAPRVPPAPPAPPPPPAPARIAPSQANNSQRAAPSRPALPGRNSLSPQGTSLRPPQQRVPPPRSPEPEPEPEPEQMEYENYDLQEQPPTEQPEDRKHSLGQRLGTIGIVVLAVVAGAAAWLATSFIKF
jgi:serine/threonine protein kinase